MTTQAELNGDKKKVLVINDENDTNILIASALKYEGYWIDNATGMEEGKRLFTVFRPDLLILDINLPDGNGLSNINFFKQIIPDIKICMISANDEVKRAYEFSAHAFLYKPFSLMQIIDITNELIGLK